MDYSLYIKTEKVKLSSLNRSTKYFYLLSRNDFKTLNLI